MSCKNLFTKLNPSPWLLTPNKNIRSLTFLCPLVGLRALTGDHIVTGRQLVAAMVSLVLLTEENLSDLGHSW